MANRIKTRDQELRRKAAGGNARAGWGPTANSGERNLEFILKGLITQSVIWGSASSSPPESLLYLQNFRTAELETTS